MSLRVLLAAKQILVLHAIKAALTREGLEVVGQASDGGEAIVQCRNLQPQVAILEVSMPPQNGMDATSEIRRVCPKTRIVMLGDYEQTLHIKQSLDAGANGYVLKADTAAELARAVYAVSSGQTYIAPSVSSFLKARLMHAGRDPLTARERQVLRLMAEGENTKEIADFLGISPKTVRVHRDNIMRKLDLHDTPSLIRYSVDSGLMDSSFNLPVADRSAVEVSDGKKHFTGGR